MPVMPLAASSSAARHCPFGLGFHVNEHTITHSQRKLRFSSRALQHHSSATHSTYLQEAPQRNDRIAACDVDETRPENTLHRRSALLLAPLAASLALGIGDAKASKLPEALDKGWTAMGGGPSDLVFPEDFLGRWDVESVLTNVELPLGPEFVPDMAVVQRAQHEDLQQRVRYQVGFIRNARGEVVPDRRFNTASLMQTYLGRPVSEVSQRILWNPDDPNLLQMSLPGGLEVTTRVMRRAEEQLASDRLDTSEYFQQMIDTPERLQPKVKGSQCFTKYKWRDGTQLAAAAAGGAEGGAGQQGGTPQQGPLIVATQVVSDYLTPFDDPGLMMRAANRPVTIYTYRMAFWRAEQPQ